MGTATSPPRMAAVAVWLLAVRRRACPPQEGRLLMSAVTPMADAAYGAISTNLLCENREGLGREQWGESQQAGRETRSAVRLWPVPVGAAAAKPSSSLAPPTSLPKQQQKSGEEPWGRGRLAGVTCSHPLWAIIMASGLPRQSRASAQALSWQQLVVNTAAPGLCHPREGLDTLSMTPNRAATEQ